MNEDIIIALYADYHSWCKVKGIPPECWESFHNTLARHGEAAISRLGYQFRSDTPGPIQPNDEQRAVAEVMRMLRGKS